MWCTGIPTCHLRFCVMCCPCSSIYVFVEIPVWTTYRCIQMHFRVQIHSFCSICSLQWNLQKDLYLGTEVRGSIMYDIYISDLVASSRNHCLHKGITGRKSQQSTLAGTQQYKRERDTHLQDHSNASVQDLGWPSCQIQKKHRPCSFCQLHNR